MANEKGIPVPLIGILVEAAQRNWTKRLVCEMAHKWARLNTPTAGELRALKMLKEEHDSYL
jgi:hypothetical protein